MKIFIDAGAHNGCSVRKFREETDVDIEYDIYSFEVDPRYKDSFKDIPKHTFINKAVWIYDGKAQFYRSGAKMHDGGTLIKNKKSGKLDKNNPIKVDTIDLSMWVKENFAKDDYIVLKLDIEGAEYEVLKKMIEDKTIDYINELWIEWHWKKIGLAKAIHNDLASKINVPVRDWCALRWI